MAKKETVTRSIEELAGDLQEARRIMEELVRATHADATTEDERGWARAWARSFLDRRQVPVQWDAVRDAHGAKRAIGPRWIESPLQGGDRIEHGETETVDVSTYQPESVTRSGPCCRARGRDGHVCTRVAGHRGIHIAEAWGGGEVARWHGEEDCRHLDLEDTLDGERCRDCGAERETLFFDSNPDAEPRPMGVK